MISGRMPLARAKSSAIALVPGLVVAFLEALVFILRGSPSRARFPLYERLSFWRSLDESLQGPFVLVGPGDGICRRISWLPSIPEVGVGLAVIALAIFAWKRWGLRGTALALGGLALFLWAPQFFGARALPQHELYGLSLPVTMLLVGVALVVGIGEST